MTVVGRDAARIASHHTGRGPALVLLHPLGADRHVWNPVVPRLAEERTVIALDLPGFGRSAPLTGLTPTPRALADAVAAEIARLIPEHAGRVHVAGNSLGGWVALELALMGVAASVTAIAPAGLWPEPLKPRASLAHGLGQRLLPLALSLTRTRLGRRLLLGGSMAHPGRVPPADARELVRAYALAPGFVAVHDAMRAARFGGLERVRAPVTLVWPDRDRLVDRPRWIPDGVRELVLPDAGHIPMWDAPQALVRMLLEGSGGGPG